MEILSSLLTDGYKQAHQAQYPKNTELVYSNLTPRNSRLEGVDHVVVFGLQYFIKEYLIRQFNENFFDCPKNYVLHRHKRRLDNYFGKDVVDINHIGELHDLGYLPVEIKALAEGTRCPLRVPLLTIQNTHKRFAWVTNFLETLLCNVIWQPITSATIAYECRKNLDEWAYLTSDIPEFVKFQSHDFSQRGMSSVESAFTSGMGHLTSFAGTDTIGAIDFLEEYYGADASKELVGASIPSSEHSVMTIGGKESEAEIFKRLITESYPEGMIGIVCDSYDYWKTINETVRDLKDVILARNGKVICRPDSGVPEKIMCGDLASSCELEKMGTIRLLWDIFEGRTNNKGYRQLDDHIGAVYGDSITLNVANTICANFEEMGFASTNIAYGFGSFSYQYNTRDTFGLAMKATYAEVDGKPINIYKDPKTDSGMKKSAKGLLMVMPEIIPDPNGGMFSTWGKLKLHQEVSKETEKNGLLKTVFKDGLLTKEFTLKEIRNKLNYKAWNNG